MEANSLNPVSILLIIEPVHEISNNVACATSKASDQYSMIVKLLIEHHKGGCRGSSESATLLEISCTGSVIAIGRQS